MGRYSNIIVTGSVAWDIIMDFPRKFVDYFQPEMLHQINVSFVVDRLEKQLGGTATNISYAISQSVKAIPNKSEDWSSTPVRILGAVGKDGADHLAFFKKNGIEIKGILTDREKYNASGTVITDMKDNQIWGYYYGACETGKNARYDLYADKTSLMVVSANHPQAFMAAQDYAVKNGIDYMYDVGMALSWIKQEALAQGVRNSKWLIGNDYEIALVAKKMKTSVEKLTSQGAAVITTLGDQGVRAVQGKQTYMVPACKVTKVIDPTGAGDAWRGGFIAAHLAGYGFEECLKFGNAVASFVIESYGTVNYKIGKKALSDRVNDLN